MSDLTIDYGFADLVELYNNLEKDELTPIDKKILMVIVMNEIKKTQ